MTNETTQVSFRKKILKAIEKKGTTIAKLSRLADVNTSAVYNYLNGKADMTGTNIEKLMTVLNAM